MVIFQKTIGIIGGAGPMASAFLYTTILEVCQKEYEANDYSEFPEIILISYPFTRENSKKIKQELSTCFYKLQIAGSSLYCIASNSFHGYLPQLPAGFVNLIKEALNKAYLQSITQALILSAQTTIYLKLYENTEIHCVYPRPEEQKIINQLIREIAGGKIEDEQSHLLRKVIIKISQYHPFDGIIIACTELPLLHKKNPFSNTLPVIDTVEVLAKELVHQAR